MDMSHEWMRSGASGGARDCVAADIVEQCLRPSTSRAPPCPPSPSVPSTTAERHHASRDTVPIPAGAQESDALEQEFVGGRREGRWDRKRPRMESRRLLPPLERKGRASPVGEQDVPGDDAKNDARAACLPRSAARVLVSALRARQRASWWPSTPHPAQGAGGGWPVARV
jgi:hypothetical protein